ncbi:MAG: ribosomal protection tetracycline resistance protein [Halioglobus sp.]|jgi:ribosomal protection tetracycline resistance protein
MLYESGATKDRGSVDQGSAITDGMAMEKDRGISIKTATVDFEWKGTHINIVDTPGHVDFSAEVDRALSVLDLVVLVISAVEGVQAHTLNLWESIKERRIPAIIFINKIDRAGADPEDVFRELEKDLGASLFALNYPNIISPKEFDVVDFSNSKEYLSSYIIDKSLANLAEVDESFFEAYLDGNTSNLLAILSKSKMAIGRRELTPVLFGSAKMHSGIDRLLDVVIGGVRLERAETENLNARVFKVEYDSKLGRLAHVRIFNGAFRTKDTIQSSGAYQEVKINQIFQSRLGKLVQVKELGEGDIGVITTSDVVLAGDMLGAIVDSDSFSAIIEPVLSVQAVAKEEKDYQKLGEALEILNVEDPQIDFRWYKDEREYHLKILGPIQTEVMKDSLARRFGIEADFLPPTVIYKETPKSTAEGYVRYWMPKPCWAIMTFKIEPGELGSGVTFDSKVRTSDISTKYQNEVKRAVPWSLRQGIKGWEVTDIKIILIEGSEHNVHSNPGDFLLATPMGVTRGIEAADTDLLEPMYAFKIKAHSDLLGSIASDLNQMKGTIGIPIFDCEFFTLEGRVAVAKAMDYSIKFNATTSGKGRLKLKLDGYQKTVTTDEKIRPYRGVSPLDESLWILHNRGAFKAEDRKR